MRCDLLTMLTLVVACGGSDTTAEAPANVVPTDTAPGGGGSAGPSGAVPDGSAPEIHPTPLLVTYVGGGGNQYLREVAFANDGSVTAKGKGFSVTYDAAYAHGVVTGDASTGDTDAYSEKPVLYKQTNTQWTPANGAKRLDDPRFGLTYYLGTQQVSGDLQQPIFLGCRTDAASCTKDEFDFELWGWWASLAKDPSLSLAADSRGYDAWLMPGGLVGLQLWTDGGNSTLGRDPRRTQTCSDATSCTTIRDTLEATGTSKGTWQPAPNSMSTMYMTIDPVKKTPVRATFLRGSHVTRIAHDAWGRLIIPQAVGKAFPTVDPENPLGHSTSAKSGLFVLDASMNAVTNIRIGGTCDGVQVLPELALHDGILVMAGTTCAADLKVTDNAVQKTPGGGQDGFLVILKLW